MEFCLRPNGADKHRMDFLRISWISDGFPWIWTGFSTVFMDLEWIFHGIHGFQLDFHGSGMDFLRMSCLSGKLPWSNPPTSLQVGVLDLVWIGVFLSLMKLPLMDFLGMGWIWGGFSMEFMDLGLISMDLAWIFYGCHGCRVNFHGVDIDE